MTKLPLWIEEKGLSFKCTGCGACCTGSPGYVWLEESDIVRMMEFLKLDRDSFLKNYCRSVGNRISLIEDSKTYDCVFLKNNKCSLYNARPKQCRVYPFWDEVIKSKKDWDREVFYCEGINHKEGRLVSKEEIQKIRVQAET